MIHQCLICKKTIEPTETPHKHESCDEPTFSHELCYWKYTAFTVTRQLAQIEATIETGNTTVGILAGLLHDLIEYAEMGANWAITNFIETDLKKIDFLKDRVNTAKKIVAQFGRDLEKKEKKAHICTPQCRHS